MHDRRTRIVAALIGLFLLEAGGCARREMNLRRQDRQRPATVGAVAVEPTDNELLQDKAAGDRLAPPSDGSGYLRRDPRLDAAFQRLHQAREKIPRHLPSATGREVPPPPTRVASPFARPGQQQQSAVR